MGILSYSYSSDGSNYQKVFLIIFSLALGLRFVGINDSLVSDELVSVSIWGQMPLFQIPQNYQVPNNHIFHNLLVGLVLKVIGVNEFALRLPALIGGLASIVLVFVCAKKITDNSVVALGAAFLITINIEHVYYSTNARGYTLVQAFALIIFLLIFPLNKTSNENVRRNTEFGWAKSLLIFLLCALGSWTIPTFAFFIGSLILGTFWIFIYLEIDKRENLFFYMKVIFFLAFSLCVLYLEYFVIVPKGMLANAISKGAEVDPVNFFSDLIAILAERRLWLGFGIFIFAGIGMVEFYRKHREVFFWFGNLFFAPIVVVFLAYWVGVSDKIPHPRVLIYLQPFFFICFSYGLWQSINKFTSYFGEGEGFQKNTILGYSLFIVPILFFSTQDFQIKQIKERNARPPYDEGLSFFRKLNSNDLILASKQTHVWFYLYGAQEMRKRVLEILKTGKLGDVYFVESFGYGQDQSDLKVRSINGKIDLDMSDFSFHPLALGGVGHIQLSKRVWSVEKDFGAFRIYKIPSRYFIRTLSLHKLNDKEQWTIFPRFKDKIRLTNSETDPSIILEYKDSFFISGSHPRKFESTDLSLNINFLMSNVLTGSNPIFSGADEKSSQVKFAPTWLANDWVMEHPYGSGVFSRSWSPSIFLSTGGKGLVLAGELRNGSRVGKLKNVLGFQLAIS